MTKEHGPPIPLVEKLHSDPRSIIYVATRLFDIEEKIKAERLEESVLDGVKRASALAGFDIPTRAITFVPFRDSAQEQLESHIKTRLLYEQDIDRLDRTLLVVAYIDGLAKDEGICFELGYAYSKRIPILLISTDFISHRLPTGFELPLDPLLWMSASSIVRHPRIELNQVMFLDNLLATRKNVLSTVSKEVEQLLTETYPSYSIQQNQWNHSDRIQIFAEFGGELFEWQTMLADKLAAVASENPHLILHRPCRYLVSYPTGEYASKDIEPPLSLAQVDLTRAASSRIVILCSDADEYPSGSAFIQGFAKGLGREVWLYDSKRTKIIGPGGYESSRNLMIDCSANRVFRNFSALVEQIARL